ncbi:hypothetical protein PVAND_015917 [Polypedilum vanderplanki]|uniref:Elongation of very long chain fatty acids protein n=1 Tax=Polypedilum vanderplanki TaxID=319348 RepID=A0A9J6BEL0_POLVA|nr:hypothetical protein PVAND_015917 [Polypedilum vanderplanki]
MTSLIKNIQVYFNYLESLSDPRSKGWFMVDSVVPALSCFIIYILIVFIGPKIMRNRKPFKLNNLLIFYNFFLVALNLYITLKILTSAYKLNYKFFCQPYQRIISENDIQIVKAMWLLYMSKIIELNDTFFFILRKKDSQLSFLHIYHHSLIVLAFWFGVKWIPSGSVTLGSAANAFVHVVMYFYYGLSAIGVETKRILWLKKSVTIIQLIQFTAFILFMINGFTLKCEFPLWIIYILLPNCLLFIILFGQFYLKTYTKDDKNCKKKIN